MTSIFKSLLSLLVISLSCFVFFWISIGEHLLRLNTTQLDMAGDGFKNYYTFAYQYKYGRGIHFDGFMYPYGDLATYADAQIFFVWVLQGLRSIGLNVEPYLLGVINCLPLISFIVAGLFLVKIFEHYKIAYPSALLFSIVCIALSPQIFRVQSHYALAYAYLIPAIWWMNLKRESSIKRSWVWIGISCVFVFAHGFIHPYLIFISALFLLSLWFYNLVFQRELSLGILVQGLLPILSFLLIMNGIDEIADRPKNPYGLLIHKTEVSDLLPFFGWMKSVFGELLNLRDNYSEGYTYTGILMFIVPLLLLVRRAFKVKDQVQDKLVISSSLWSYFGSGILCLAFGMGLHIFLTGGLLLDFLPMIKQFRAMGRVSWVFYYTIFVFLSIVFYQLFESIESKGFKYTLLALVIGLWGLDIYNYHKSLNKIVTTYKSDDLLSTSTLIGDLLADKDIDPSKFQAVWVLPSSTEGTEKVSFRDDWSSKMNAIPFSYQTGLPLTSIVMSRSSISNSLKIIQLSSSSYVEKEMLSDLESEKPFLIILQNDRVELFQDVLERSNFIIKAGDFSLYEISIDSLRLVENLNIKEYEKASNIIESNGIYLDFENETEEGLLSDGCLLIDGDFEVFEIDITLQDTSEFGLSLWYKILPDKTDVPYFNLQALDASYKIQADHHFRDWDMQRVEVIDDWIRLKKSFEVGPDDKYLRLIAHGQHLHLDRVLIKPRSLEFKAETRDSNYVQWNHIIGQIER